MTGNCRNVRILVIASEHLAMFLRGEARVTNLPADGVIVAALPIGNRIGVRVHSSKFSVVEYGAAIPCITAMVERQGLKVAA